MVTQPQPAIIVQPTYARMQLVAMPFTTTFAYSHSQATMVYPKGNTP